MGLLEDINPYLNLFLKRLFPNALNLRYSVESGDNSSVWIRVNSPEFGSLYRVVRITKLSPTKYEIVDLLSNKRITFNLPTKEYSYSQTSYKNNQAVQYYETGKITQKPVSYYTPSEIKEQILKNLQKQGISLDKVAVDVWKMKNGYNVRVSYKVLELPIDYEKKGLVPLVLNELKKRGLNNVYMTQSNGKIYFWAPMSFNIPLSKAIKGMEISLGNIKTKYTYFLNANFLNTLKNLGIDREKEGIDKLGDITTSSVQELNQKIQKLSRDVTNVVNQQINKIIATSGSSNEAIKKLNELKSKVSDRNIKTSIDKVIQNLKQNSTNIKPITGEVHPAPSEEEITSKMTTKALQNLENMYKGKKTVANEFMYELTKALIKSGLPSKVNYHVEKALNKVWNKLADLVGWNSIKKTENFIKSEYMVGKIDKSTYQKLMNQIEKAKRDAITKATFLLSLPLGFIAPDVATSMIGSELVGNVAYKITLDKTKNRDLAVLADILTQVGAGIGLYKSLDEVREAIKNAIVNKYKDIRLHRLDLKKMELPEGQYKILGSVELRTADGRTIRGIISGSGEKLDLVPVDNPSEAISVRINPKVLQRLKDMTKKLMLGKGSPEDLQKFLKTLYDYQKSISEAAKKAGYFDVQSGLTDYEIVSLNDLGEGIRLRVRVKPELLKSYKSIDEDLLSQLIKQRGIEIDLGNGEVIHAIKLGNVEVGGYVYYFDPINGKIIKIPVQLEDIASKFKQAISVRSLGNNAYYIQVDDLTGYTVKLKEMKDGTKVWEVNLIDPRTNQVLASKTIPVGEEDELLDFIKRYPNIASRYKLKLGVPKKSLSEEILGSPKIMIGKSTVGTLIEGGKIHVNLPPFKLPLSLKQPLKIELKGKKASIIFGDLGKIADIPRKIVDNIITKRKVDQEDIRKLANYIKNNLKVDFSFLNRLDLRFNKVIIERGRAKLIVPVTSKAKVVVRLPMHEQIQKNEQLLKRMENTIEKQKSETKQILDTELSTNIKFGLPEIPEIGEPQLKSSKVKFTSSKKSKKKKKKRIGARGRLKTKFFIS